MPAKYSRGAVLFRSTQSLELLERRRGIDRGNVSIEPCYTSNNSCTPLIQHANAAIVVGTSVTVNGTEISIFRIGEGALRCVAQLHGRC